jgi:hypothetical protein
LSREVLEIYGQLVKLGEVLEDFNPLLEALITCTPEELSEGSHAGLETMLNTPRCDDAETNGSGVEQTKPKAADTQAQAQFQEQYQRDMKSAEAKARIQFEEHYQREMTAMACAAKANAQDVERHWQAKTTLTKAKAIARKIWEQEFLNAEHKALANAQEQYEQVLRAEDAKAKANAQEQYERDLMAANAPLHAADKGEKVGFASYPDHPVVSEDVRAVFDYLERLMGKPKAKHQSPKLEQTKPFAEQLMVKPEAKHQGPKREQTKPNAEETKRPNVSPVPRRPTNGKGKEVEAAANPGHSVRDLANFFKMYVMKEREVKAKAKNQGPKLEQNKPNAEQLMANAQKTKAEGNEAMQATVEDK